MASTIRPQDIVNTDSGDQALLLDVREQFVKAQADINAIEAGIGFDGNVTVPGNFTVTGTSTLGDATTDAHTLTGTVHLGNAAGGESLRAVPVVSAVTRVEVYGDITGAPSGGARIYGRGSDTNVGLVLGTQGAGSIRLATSVIDLTQVTVTHTASSNRFVTITGSNGGNPTIGTSAGSLAVSAPLVLSQTTLLSTSVALTNGAGASSGTLTNAPAAGNPTKWIPISDNGTTRYIPAW